ncbi:hypothetical protein MSKU15_3552 [Komagataeibacter diospyri]|nr:hypothetical protein MSKU15_3552 [Komagataeibacter diospyri]
MADRNEAKLLLVPYGRRRPALEGRVGLTGPATAVEGLAGYIESMLDGVADIVEAAPAEIDVAPRRDMAGIVDDATCGCNIHITPGRDQGGGVVERGTTTIFLHIDRAALGMTDKLARALCAGHGIQQACRHGNIDIAAARVTMAPQDGIGDDRHPAQDIIGDRASVDQHIPAGAVSHDLAGAVEHGGGRPAGAIADPDRPVIRKDGPKLVGQGAGQVQGHTGHTINKAGIGDRPARGDVQDAAFGHQGAVIGDRCRRDGGVAPGQHAATGLGRVVAPDPQQRVAPGLEQHATVEVPRERHGQRVPRDQLRSATRRGRIKRKIARRLHHTVRIAEPGHGVAAGIRKRQGILAGAFDHAAAVIVQPGRHQGQVSP